MRNTVMNTRMRIDFELLWPELTNNNMRLCGNPLKEYNSGDNSEDGTEGGGFNYYLPPGYLKNMSFSENTMFIVKTANHLLVQLPRRRHRRIGHEL